MLESMRVYTTKEASLLLQCHPRTVRNWCIKYQLGTTHKIGTGKHHVWVLTQADLEKLSQEIQKRIVRRAEYVNAI